jgi:hypothetical protein
MAERAFGGRLADRHGFEERNDLVEPREANQDIYEKGWCFDPRRSPPRCARTQYSFEVECISNC